MYAKYNVYLKNVFELVSGLVRIFTDAFAQDDAPFVQEDVPLHGLESKLTQSVALTFGPHAETAL